MTLPKFIFGMMLVTSAVGIWSAFAGYTTGELLFRFVLCLILLQVGYFVYVLIQVTRRGRELPSAHMRESERDVAPLDGHNIPNH